MPSPGYLTDLIRYGASGGLDLSSAPAVDTVPPGSYSQLTNLFHTRSGSLSVRPGQALLASTGQAIQINSMGRLNAQRGSPLYARFVGAGDRVYIGQTALSLVSGGWSNSPKIFCPHRTPLSGQPWMFIADPLQMRKVRIDGLNLPIGLPAPGGPPTVTAAPELTVAIEEFAAGFTGYAGSGGAPTLTYPAAKVGLGLNIATNKGAATGAYINYADKPLALIDLTTFGIQPSTDDDFIHLWLKVDNPQYLAEVRVYLITSAFTAGYTNVPGTSATANISAYMKAFRAGDITPVIEQQTVFIPVASADVSTNDLLIGAVAPDNISVELDVGRGTWTEYGSLDLPLRKAEFTAIGTPDWASVQAIAIWVKTNAAQNINVTIDNAFLRGGYDLDTAITGAELYTWKTTNYDPRTGAEGNASAASDPPAASLRQAGIITPAPAGDGNIRQRFYRFGGTRVDDWHFEGVNTADGGALLSTLADDALGDTTPPTDHYQPVPTIDDAGNTVLAQPLSVIFGPFQGMLLGLGDPYRPGFLYRTQPDAPDHWVAEATEVCTGSEQLVAGDILGTEAYAFSQERGYHIIPNLSGTGGLTALPTNCTHGPVSRVSLISGGGSLWLVAKDGIYRTNGLDEGVPISGDLWPLFHGLSAYGYSPIDFTELDSCRLDVSDNDLWFTYRATDGLFHCLIYSITYQYWRAYDFGEETSCVYAERGVVPLSILLGSRLTGTVYTHAGDLDAGNPIDFLVHTGALDQGLPRSDKRYGQLYLDTDLGGVALVVGVRFTNDTEILPVQTIAAASGRNRYFLPLITAAGEPYLRRNISVEITGSATGTTALFLAGIAYQFEATDYLRWESGWTDHGLAVAHTPFSYSFAIRSTAPVTLTRQINKVGGVIATDTYTIPATGGIFQRLYVPVAAVKGIQCYYTFTSLLPFSIDAEQSVVKVQPWPGGALLELHLLGTTDPARPVEQLNSLLAAQRPGGSL